MSTVTGKSYVVAVDQQQQEKNRRFLRIILIFVGVIILLAALFLAIVIYRTLKTGAILVYSFRFREYSFAILKYSRHSKEKFSCS